MASGLSPDPLPEVPLLTVEEEMQYQRALWLNRLLKEQLAQLTHNLTIEEIDAAKEQLQAQLGMATGMTAPGGNPADGDNWLVRPAGEHGGPTGAGFFSGPDGGASRSKMSPRNASGSSHMLANPSPRRQVTASSAVNRKKREQQIDRENLAFLRRLQGVKSSFHALPAPTSIPKIHNDSRLLLPSRRDAAGMLA